MERHPRRDAPEIPRRTVALGVWLATLVGFVISAPAGALSRHTAFNHFALQAEAWLHGRMDLGGPPPAYTQMNDFAVYGDRFFISFPPLPAVLITPLVWLKGSAERVPDGFFFLLFAPLAPTFLFLALERLRSLKRSARSQRDNVLLSLALPFATVFWFSAVQGTVWFAAHAVGTALAALFLFASIDAERPALAGFVLGLGFATRAPLLFAAPLFVVELVLVARAAEQEGPRLFGLATRTLFPRAARFAAPLALILALLIWHNHARFGDAFEFGHRYLEVVWRPRMDKWGLFSPHYLSKNLGAALASTPFLGVKGAPFAISPHGLALWITSPFLALALWPRALPRRARATFVALALTAICVAVPSLLYHNTGWVQFGYRFSNDYVVFLIAMLALGRRRMGPPFHLLLAWSFAVNAFGAVSFQRPGYERFYRTNTPQTVMFEPD